MAEGSSDRRVALLGRGAFGEVELVVRREGRFERLFAKKRLLPVHQEDVELRSMFFEEARLAGMIRHPNVVSVLDVGEDEQGPYLLMDYVEGVSAHRLIEASLGAQRPIPLQVCLRIVAQVAEGLHAAHELSDREGRPLGLVHRDVSPANVLLGYDGIARVTDFGVARALGRTTKTSTGFLKGKFGYMSPEQLRFEEPDRRSDLFALGVVLFELIALRRLYANKDGMDGARRILHEPPPDLADHREDVPDALIQLSFAMLAKAREHRPPDARAVAVALEEVSAALTLEEGRLDVADHLGDVLGEERSAARARVAEALAAPVEEVVLPTRVQPLPVRPRRASKAPWIGAAVVAAGIAAALVLRMGEGADEAEALAAEVATDDAPAEAQAPAVAAPEPAATVPPASVAPTAPVSAAPKKRPRKPKPSTTPSPGVPMWSW